MKKKYLVFIISFLILLGVIEILSGMILTLAHTPDVEEAWSQSRSLASETVITSSVSWITILGAAISATIAFFISKAVKPKGH